MTFEQLQYFIAAVESDTFFDAAEKLHITQSTLSKHIKKMEKELQISLFDRQGRSALLTEAGKLFYQEAQSLFASYQQTLHKLEAFRVPSPNNKSSLRIGALPILTQYNLAAPIHAFMEKHPEISVSLSEAEEPELLSGLEKDQFDLIFARETMITKEHLTFLPLATDRLSVMLPAQHPLANQSFLSIPDIALENFILMHPYTAIYQLCQKLFSNAGITPNILRTARMESIISAVRFGEAISLFPESNFQTFAHQGLVAVPLLHAPKLVVGMAYKKEQESLPALSTFLTYFNR